LDESSVVLDSFIQAKSGSEEFAGIVIEAANFFLAAERSTQAITLLESARDSQSDALEIDSALGTMHFTQGLYHEAAEILDQVVQKTGNNVLQSRLIEALAMSGQFEKAEQALVAYKTTNTGYAKAMLRALISRVKAEQLLAQGDIGDAKGALVGYRNALQAAISEDPANQIPYIQLCRSLLSEYRLTQNKALLEEALLVADKGSELNKKSEQFEIVRSDVLQADGQLQKAITRMARFLASNPGANNVRQRLVEAFLDTNKIDKAIVVTEEGIQNDPSISIWYKRLGDLQLRANDDRRESVKAYLSALQREPSSVRLLYQIDSITRTDQPLPDRALLSMAQGPMSKLHPIVNSIEAKALMNLGRTRDALIAMEKSWKGFQRSVTEGWIPLSSMGVWYLDLAEMFSNKPEEGEVMIRSLAGGTLTPEQKVGLASYYYVFGDAYVDKALAILDETIASQNVSSRTRAQLLMMRGGYLVELGRFEESEQAFQTLVDEQSSPLVMNNLAYVIGVYLDEPTRGLVLAKQAAKLAPRVPAIIDTVATLYERVGDTQKSAETLDFLVQVDPANAAALSRLSLLYAGSLAEPERALVFAERARSLSPRSPDVLDALGWSYYQTGRKAIGEDFLLRSLKYGDTFTTYLHLAQILMHRGEYEEALDHLRMAQELAEDVYSMKRVTALQDDIRNSQASVPE
jgi:tetratricopeptide (TPR) repeat protein